MNMSKDKKDIIEKFGKNAQDTGSISVQIALWTDKINKLSEHFKKNIHDFASRRGLLKMVSRRRKALQYLEKTNQEEYKSLIKQLGLRK